MLLRRVGQKNIGISQPHHAWISGELARAWGAPGFETPKPRETIVCATALHDIGWLDWELHPGLDSDTGLPLQFQDVPAEIHTGLWRRGVDHARLYGDHVALLVSRHGDAIYERTFDPATARPEAVDAVRPFRAEQSALQREIIARIATDPEVAATVSEANLDFAKRFIVAVDTMSLHFCWGVSENLTITDVPQTADRTTSITLSRQRGGEVSVVPWPFVPKKLHLTIEGRTFQSEPQQKSGRVTIYTILRPA